MITFISMEVFKIIISELIREEEETFEDYALRIYRNQSVLGLTNKEIGKLLNHESGNNYDESAYRKKYKVGIEYYDKGFMEGYNRGIDENSKFDGRRLADELFKEREKNYKIKRQMQDKMREYRKLLTFEARSDNLKDTIRECVDDISKDYPILDNTFEPSPLNNLVGILQLSDWHYGEVVEDFLNTYNHDIFMSRIEKLTNDTIRYCKVMGVHTLKVLNLGDLISGDIHVSTRVNNEEDLISQLITVSEVLGQMLEEFAKHVNVEFYTVTDNHSRTNKSKPEHVEQESYQRFIPFWLKPRLQEVHNIKIMDNKIYNIEDYEIGVVDIFDEVAFFTHGHNDKVNSVATDLTTMIQEFPIAIFLGHIHHNVESEDNKIDVIVNPSLIGSGIYSKSLRKVSIPRQKLTLYEKDDKVKRVGTFFVGL